MSLTFAAPALVPAPLLPGDLAHTVAASALFASTLDPSGHPSRTEAMTAVATSLRKHGKHACAAWVAHEYGNHPDSAAARMRWALEVTS